MAGRCRAAAAAPHMALLAVLVAACVLAALAQFPTKAKCTPTFATADTYTAHLAPR